MDIATPNINPSDAQQYANLFNGLGNGLFGLAFIIAIVACIIFFVRKKKAQVAESKKPIISRTAFAKNVFGIIYEPTTDNPIRRAAVFGADGKEVMSLSEADDQEFYGFAVENDMLYLYTIENKSTAPYEDKWLYIESKNDFKECE